MLQSLELRTVARPHLERLAIETSYTVGLAIMNNWEMVYLDQLNGTGVIRLEFRIGSRWPIHCTAAGKAYLAFQSEKEIDRFLSQGSLKRYTENTIVNVKKLKEELKNIKSQGYALNNEEYQKEVKAIGSPIFNLHKKAMATVVMAAPVGKIKKGNIQAIGKRVQKTALAISGHMGFIE
jgi:DNA-binding IclR family transcriptional regulator